MATDTTIGPCECCGNLDTGTGTPLTTLPCSDVFPSGYPANLYLWMNGVFHQILPRLGTNAAWGCGSCTGCVTCSAIIGGNLSGTYGGPSPCPCFGIMTNFVLHSTSPLHISAEIPASASWPGTCGFSAPTSVDIYDAP